MTVKERLHKLIDEMPESELAELERLIADPYAPRKRKIPPNVAAALAELKSALTSLYGERLREIYLFGSYARGDYRDYSDVDVLIVLAGPVDIYEEMNRYSQIVSEICLQYDLLITIVPVAEESFRRSVEALYENVKREGIAL